MSINISSLSHHSYVSGPMLATFALVSYNQEQFIREAVEGAFCQTYSPLQIILSDDCSTDSTFEIMKALARDYHGPHEILLNRNKNNLGLAMHINQIIPLINGEIFIAAAGDDIAHPNRSAVIVQTFQSNENLMGCASMARAINGESRVIEEKWRFLQTYLASNCLSNNEKIHGLIDQKRVGLLGGSAAYRSFILTQLSPLLSGADIEDTIFTLRCLLFGEIKYIPDILLDYRQSSHNRSKVITQQRFRSSAMAFRQMLIDLDFAQNAGVISNKQKAKYRVIISKAIHKMDVCSNWISYSLVNKLVMMVLAGLLPFSKKWPRGYMLRNFFQ